MNPKITITTVLALSLTGALLAGCGSSAPPTVSGSVSDLYACCTGSDPYVSVGAGTRIQILAPDGSVIGIGRLGHSPFADGNGGVTSGPADGLPFKIAIPPESFYMVRIVGAGVVTLYPGAPMTWKPGQRILIDLGT